MRMSEARALHVDRVSKRYGGGFVLDGVRLTLPLGTTHALVGGNGTGKSTLLRLLARIEEPTRGTVRFDGAEALEEHRGSVGYLGHDLGLYEELTGREQIAFAEELRGARLGAEERSFLGLAVFEGRPLAACSRGQRQRVALAQALVGEMPLLLLDEPTTGLDAATVAALAELLRLRAARGALVVLSTHEQAFVGSLGAHVIDVETLRGPKPHREAPPRA
jgi:ABC-type multidrug transport system ATPase subunit